MKRTIVEMTLDFVEMTLFTLYCGVYGLLLVGMYLLAVWVSGLLGTMGATLLMFLAFLGLLTGVGKTLLLSIFTVITRGLRWAHDCLTGPLYRCLGEE